LPRHSPISITISGKLDADVEETKIGKTIAHIEDMAYQNVLMK